MLIAMLMNTYEHAQRKGVVRSSNKKTHIRLGKKRQQVVYLTKKTNKIMALFKRICRKNEKRKQATHFAAMVSMAKDIHSYKYGRHIYTADNSLINLFISVQWMVIKSMTHIY